MDDSFIHKALERFRAFNWEGDGPIYVSISVGPLMKIPFPDGTVTFINTRTISSVQFEESKFLRIKTSLADILITPSMYCKNPDGSVRHDDVEKAKGWVNHLYSNLECDMYLAFEYAYANQRN